MFKMIFNNIYDILNNYTNLRQLYILKLAKKTASEHNLQPF